MLIKFEEELKDLLDDTMIDGGFIYSDENSWLTEEQAKERIKQFIISLLQKQEEETRKQVFEELERFGIHLVNKIK